MQGINAEKNYMCVISIVLSIVLYLTCVLKVFSLNTGELLLDLEMPSGVRSLTCNKSGTKLFVGCEDGNIYVSNLIEEEPRQAILYCDK